MDANSRKELETIINELMSEDPEQRPDIDDATNRIKKIESNLNFLQFNHDLCSIMTYM